ncbi:MAG: hypothetical protein V1735_06765 [Nanoarchaeota archaeon]
MGDVIADACCDLGAILKAEPERVLLETGNFFVAPSLGQIGAEGYLMVLTKEHVLGMGSLPESQYAELQEVTEKARRAISTEYGVASHVFEHGPKCGSFHGGGCLDHAHHHVVPDGDIADELALDLMRRMHDQGQFFRVDRSDSLARAAEILHAGESSYLVAEAPDGRMFIVEVNFFLPSQYCRRLIAEKRGLRQWQWDWGQFPERDSVKRTADRLRGKL